MSNIDSQLEGISTFMLAVNAGDVDWTFRAGTQEPYRMYDVTVRDPYKKFFDASSQEVKNAFISFAVFSNMSLRRRPAYRLASRNNSGTIYNFN